MNKLAQLSLQLAAVLALLPLAGCRHNGFQQQPPILLAPDVVVLGATTPPPKDAVVAKLAAMVDQYHAAYDKGDLEDAKTFRNRFVFAVMAEIETRYNTFEHGFRTTRATGETLADAALLGVSAATAVVGSAGIKDLLAAAGVAGSGARLSAEKNFFSEQSTVALLTQMRASRAEIEAQVIKRCGSPVDDFSLEEAWMDLIKYENAGSLESALIQLSANAGKQNADAHAAVAQAVRDVTPASAADVASSQQMGAIRNTLADAITPPPGVPLDPDRRAAAAAAIRTILTTIGAAPPANATPEQLAALLQAEMDAGQSDRVKLKALAAALATANKQFGAAQ